MLQGCPSPRLPSQVQLINDAYGLVVDAVLGPGVEPREVGGPCTRALATLKLLSIPLVSLDIPSGMPSGGGCVRAWETWGAPVLQLLLPSLSAYSEPVSLGMDCAPWVWQRAMSIPQMATLRLLPR